MIKSLDAVTAVFAMLHAIFSLMTANHTNLTTMQTDKIYYKSYKYVKEMY